MSLVETLYSEFWEVGQPTGSRPTEVMQQLISPQGTVLTLRCWRVQEVDIDFCL
jgi:hypothetical protein